MIWSGTVFRQQSIPCVKSSPVFCVKQRCRAKRAFLPVTFLSKSPLKKRLFPLTRVPETGPTDGSEVVGFHPDAGRRSAGTPERLKQNNNKKDKNLLLVPLVAFRETLAVGNVFWRRALFLLEMLSENGEEETEKGNTHTERGGGETHISNLQKLHGVSVPR